MVADFQVQVGRFLFDRAAQKIVDAQCHGDKSQLSGFSNTAERTEILELWPIAKVAPVYRPSKRVVGPGSGLVTLSGGTGLEGQRIFRGFKLPASACRTKRRKADRPRIRRPEGRPGTRPG